MYDPWHPLNIFKQGLQNSANIAPKFVPLALSACLKVAQYCIRVSPGFLPTNRLESIAISMISESTFAVSIPLNLAGMNDTPSEVLQMESPTLNLIIESSQKGLIKLQFNYTEVKIDKNIPRLYLNEIPLMNSQFDALVSLSLEKFNNEKKMITK